jgi:uncharacterized membrane protein
MKTETLSILIVMLCTDALVLAVLLWMPVMRKERAFFGVRVSRETYAGEGRRIRRRYWLSIAAVYGALTAVGLITSYLRNNFLYAAAAYVISLPFSFILYASFAREMRAFRVPSDVSRFAGSLKTRRLADYTLVGLEILVVILTLAPPIILTYYYPALPERVPIHWGLNGQPDAWARKTFSTVFFLPVLTAYLQGWFLLLKYDLAHARMTLPAEQAEVYLKYKERLMVASLRMMDWVRGWTAFLLSTVSMFIIITSIEGLRGWMRFATIALWSSLGMLLAGIFYLLYQMMKVDSDLETETGNADVRRESEEAKWSGGGMFYHNPDDPSLMVEKKDGLGFTYNFAGKGVGLRMAALAGVPLLALWAFLSL